MKNYPKHCIDCDAGTYEVRTITHEQTCQDGSAVTIQDVEVLRCPNCGEELIPAASSKKISAAIAEANEQLKPEQLYAMMECFETDSQKELAETCGFGEKTFHRWLKGTQTVSRSMGYYLRVLQTFPEAFEFVKSRAWRNQQGTPQPLATAPHNRTSLDHDNVVAFPALARRGNNSFTPPLNPTQIFAESSF
jgi:YgiT-type zinc finger domain-containing protein